MQIKQSSIVIDSGDSSVSKLTDTRVQLRFENIFYG